MKTENKNHLVSVIIPTYNRATLVSRAIKSVFNQTYTNYEIIVVDDGSTDNTQAVLKDYSDRIKYIYQENAGVSAARNRGIKEAKGKWVAFLDSDDIWMPAKLSRQVEILKKSKSKVSYTNIVWNWGKEESFHLQEKRSKNCSQVFCEPFELLFFDPGHKVLSTLIVDRDLLMKVGCFDERINYHEDVRVCFKLAFETSFIYIRNPLAVFDRTKNLERISINNAGVFDSMCGDAVTRAEAYLQSKDKNHRIIKELRHQLGHYTSMMAKCALQDGNKYAARRFALDALYFGGHWRTYRRALAVLLCPWIARRVLKNSKKQPSK